MIYQRGKVIYQIGKIIYQPGRNKLCSHRACEGCMQSFNIVVKRVYNDGGAKHRVSYPFQLFFLVTSQMKLTKRKCICHQALKIALFLLMFLGQLFIDVSIHPSQKSWKIRYEISKNVIISFTEMSFERYIKIG